MLFRGFAAYSFLFGVILVLGDVLISEVLFSLIATLGNDRYGRALFSSPAIVSALCVMEELYREYSSSGTLWLSSSIGGY